MASFDIENAKISRHHTSLREPKVERKSLVFRLPRVVMEQFNSDPRRIVDFYMYENGVPDGAVEETFVDEISLDREYRWVWWDVVVFENPPPARPIPRI